MSKYELLLRGARVVDPSQKLDGVRDVAISQGKVIDVAVELDPGEASELIDLQGRVVMPGVIDSHVHVAGDRAVGLRMMARAGVTTAIDFASRMEDLLAGVKDYGPLLNVGGIHPISPGSTVNDENPGNEELQEQLNIALDAGSLGLKLPGGHNPLTPEATSRVIEVANGEKVYVAFHVGTTETGSHLKGLLEVEGLLGSQGRLHVAHVNSYCRGMIKDAAEEALLGLAMLKRLKGRVVSEAYLGTINGTGGHCTNGLPDSHVTRNCLKMGGYEPTEKGLEAALAGGYAYVNVDRGGETVLVQGAEARDIWHEAATDVGLSFPVNSPRATFLMAVTRANDGEFVVDAISTDGGGIPRNVTVERGLALVRYGALTLSDFVLKASCNPADMFALKDKGSLAPGKDADITVLDLERGLPTMTLVNGRVTMVNGVVTGASGKIVTTARGRSAVEAHGFETIVVDIARSRLYA